MIKLIPKFRQGGGGGIVKSDDGDPTVNYTLTFSDGLSLEERANRNKLINASHRKLADYYFHESPTIGNIFRGLYHLYKSYPMLGGEDENGNIIIGGEPPAVSINNVGSVVQGAKAAKKVVSDVKTARRVANTVNKVRSNNPTKHSVIEDAEPVAMEGSPIRDANGNIILEIVEEEPVVTRSLGALEKETDSAASAAYELYSKSFEEPNPYDPYNWNEGTNDYSWDALGWGLAGATGAAVGWGLYANDKKKEKEEKSKEIKKDKKGDIMDATAQSIVNYGRKHSTKGFGWSIDPDMVI